MNEVLREVIADELERIDDDRFGVTAVTSVDTDPDLRHATVYLSSLSDEAAEAVGQHRVRLQRAIGTQLRMKRTPELVFKADPAVASGTRVEEILRNLRRVNDD